MTLTAFCVVSEASTTDNVIYTLLKCIDKSSSSPQDITHVGIYYDLSMI